MDAYRGFAGIYDLLMDDFDYPAWADYYMNLLSQTGVQPKTMCDCACGTGAMSLQFAKKGIRVNAVAPGIIRTDFWERFLKGAFPGKEDGAFERICGAMIPMGVPQEAVDIANAICFLVSDKARYITGQTLNVCGGMAMD